MDDVGGTTIPGNLHLLTHNCMGVQILCLGSASSVTYSKCTIESIIYMIGCMLVHTKTPPRNEMGKQSLL